MWQLYVETGHVDLVVKTATIVAELHKIDFPSHKELKKLQ